MSSATRIYSDEPLEPWESEESHWDTHSAWRGSERHSEPLNSSRRTSQSVPYDVSDIQQLALIAAQQLAEAFTLRLESGRKIAELERRIQVLKAAQLQPLGTAAKPAWGQEVRQELLDFQSSEEDQCNAATLGQALRVLNMFASGVPRPEVGVDRDGHIYFEWQRAARWVFTVSISEDGMLYYAGLFGNSRNHGVEELKHALPQSIEASLTRFVAE